MLIEDDKKSTISTIESSNRTMFDWYWTSI